MKLRTAYLTFAFAAMMGAGITGTTMRGETREASLDQTCQFAVWPNIPAQCLAGDVKDDVRVIQIHSPAAAETNRRFAVAFGHASAG